LGKAAAASSLTPALGLARVNKFNIKIFGDEKHVLK
jgi:hypothetical protein